MRVLWLTAVQLPAAKGQDATSGGWLEALRAALEQHQPQIELTIVSRGRVRHEQFSRGNARYVHVPDGPPRGRAARSWARWLPPGPPREAIEECRCIARQTRPDLIHVHGTENYLGLALEGLGFPAVTSLQGIIQANLRHMTDGLGLADWVRLTATRESLHGYGLLNTVLDYGARARAESEVFGLCDDFLGRTDWDREILRSIRPDARYHRSEEVLGGVFYEAGWEDPGEEAPMFCTSGSSPIKGLEVLLDALILLHRAGRRVRLRVAGHVRGGPLWPLLRRKLDDPLLRDSVDVLGVLEPQAIARELREACLFVQPSHIDNSPNALCEAMLVGVPCIASYVGGIPSLITDGETGLLYHDREPAMLARAIERLLDDRALAVRVAQAARVRALRRHDPEAVAGGVAAVYEQIRRRQPGGEGDTP